jgi:hypothetical protein
MNQSVSKSDLSDKKRVMRQLLGVSLRALPSDFPNFRDRFSVASVRHRRISASVEGYLRRRRGARKSKKRITGKNFLDSGKRRKIW